MEMALRIIRDRMDLTQEDLAGLCGVSNSTISRLEDASDQYTGKSLGKIANKLGYPPFVLLMNADEFEAYELSLEVRQMSPEMRDYISFARQSRAATQK